MINIYGKQGQFSSYFLRYLLLRPFYHTFYVSFKDVCQQAAIKRCSSKTSVEHVLI